MRTSLLFADGVAAGRRLSQLIRQPDRRRRLALHVPANGRSASLPSETCESLSAPTKEARCRRSSRGAFHGRRDDAPGDRVPPGQYVTRDFPVLSAGPTPHTPLEQWDFSIVGEVDEPRRWTWEEFRALPSEEVTVDIHCVTKWSKLDTVWTGRLGRHAARRRRDRPPSTSSQFCDGGYTTNLPLEDVTGGKAWVAFALRRRAARARARRPGAAARPAPLLLEEREVGARAAAAATTTSPASGSQRLPQLRRPVAGAAVLGRLTWQARASVVDVVAETPRVKTLVFDVPGWPGHRAGQHVDVRLTAEDGYQAQRSYSIASAPDGTRVELTVERLDDGEVSPYLTDELRPGDQIELRGPIGGYFVWEPAQGGPLLLVAGGSGIVPLMAMIRAARRRAERRRHAPALLLARLGRRHLPRRARAARAATASPSCTR